MLNPLNEWSFSSLRLSFNLFLMYSARFTSFAFFVLLYFFCNRMWFPLSTFFIWYFLFDFFFAWSLQFSKVLSSIFCLHSSFNCIWSKMFFFLVLQTGHFSGTILSWPFNDMTSFECQTDFNSFDCQQLLQSFLLGIWNSEILTITPKTANTIWWCNTAFIFGLFLKIVARETYSNVLIPV